MRSSYCAAVLHFILVNVKICYFIKTQKIQNFFGNNIFNSFFVILQIIFYDAVLKKLNQNIHCWHSTPD